MRRARTATLVLVATIGCAHRHASTLSAPASETGAFVVKLGNDTVAVERFTRTGGTISAEQAVRAPVATLRKWTLALSADGQASAFGIESRRADGAGPRTRAVVVFGASEAVVHLLSPRDTTFRVAAREAFPFVGLSYASLEPVMARARRAGTATYAASVLPIGATQAVALPVTFLGGDSATYSVGGTDLSRARVDGAGRIMGADGAATTQKVVATRVADVDVAATAAAWSAAASGVLSPPDSVVETVGGANVRIDYSRPSLRGRQLMGYLIPYGSIWRTGANAATTLTTSADLTFGDATVPAGSYTLWTIATPQGAQLVINRQTGQWGTVYDEKRDLVRVPLDVTTTNGPPVERLTFAISPGSSSGTLAYFWGDRRFAVPFVVRGK